MPLRICFLTWKPLLVNKFISKIFWVRCFEISALSYGIIWHGKKKKNQITRIQDGKFNESICRNNHEINIFLVQQALGVGIII